MRQILNSKCAIILERREYSGTPTRSAAPKLKEKLGCVCVWLGPPPIRARTASADLHACIHMAGADADSFVSCTARATIVLVFTTSKIQQPVTFFLLTRARLVCTCKCRCRLDVHNSQVKFWGCLVGEKIWVWLV